MKSIHQNSIIMIKRFKYFLRGLVKSEYPKIELKPYIRNFDEKNFQENSASLNCFVSWKNTKLTKSHAREYLNFISKNNDVIFWFFNDKTQDQWMIKHFRNHPIFNVYTGIKFAASKSDIFRLCLLYKYGGVYTGINRVFNSKLTDIYSNQKKFLISFEKNVFERKDYSSKIPKGFQDQNVIQHTIFSPANHKILEMSIDQIVSHAPSYNMVVFNVVKEAIWNFSAPYLLTRVVDKYLDNFGTSEVEFVGYDFNQNCRIPTGAEFRYAASPSYLGSRNLPILASDLISNKVDEL